MVKQSPLRKTLLRFLLSAQLFIVLPAAAFAQDSTIKVPNFHLKIDEINPSTLGGLVASSAYFLLWVAAILAIILLMISGIQRIASAGNKESVDESEKIITAALSGLLIAIGAVLLLKTINPDLTKLKPLNITKIDFYKVEPVNIQLQESMRVDAESGMPTAPGANPASAQRYTGPISADCAQLVQQAGFHFQQDNDRDQASTGQIIRNIRDRDGNVIGHDGPYTLTPELCAGLLAIKNSGIGVDISSIIGGHRLDNGNGGTSPHINGRGVDFSARTNGAAIAQFYFVNRDILKVCQVISGDFPQYNYDAWGRTFSQNLLNDHVGHVHITFC